MSEMENKIDMIKILDEFVKTASRCYGCFGMTEELSGLDVNEMKDEMEKTNEKANMNGSKTYVIEDQSEHEIPNELVLKYIGSMIYENLIDLDSRDGDKVDTGYPLKYFGEIVKYMNKNYDISELNGVEFVEFCRELISLNIPFRMDIMNRICTGSNVYGVGWKNRCVLMNENEYEFINYIKKVWKFSELKYNCECDRVDCIIDMKYESIIKALYTYFQNKTNVEELYPLVEKFASTIDSKYDYLIQSFFDLLRSKSSPDQFLKSVGEDLLYSFINEYSFDVTNKTVQSLFKSIYSPFLKTVLCGPDYDDDLRKVAGDCKWKLLYRASEHGYSAESFHEYCDDKGPTLTIIKSTDNWIFGCYTTQSWSGDCMYYDVLY